jgi:sugar lactone lactonase YvrE
MLSIMHWGIPRRLVCACVLSVGVGAAVQATPALASTDLISQYAGTGTAGAPTPGPATSSRLNSPNGVAVDSSGNVYIADTSNNEIEKVTPGGTLSIIAGTGTAGAPTPGPATSSRLDGPYGVAVDSSGNVYIADTSNNEIEKVTPGGTLSIIAGTGTAGAPTPGPATSSRLDIPYGVAVDSSGNVYVADEANAEIEKVTPGGTLSIIAGTGTVGTPTPGPATSSRLDSPYGVAVDASGNVYIADGGDSQVLKVTPGGTLSIFAGTGTDGAASNGPATSSALGSVQGLAVDGAGNLYIADYQDIEQVTPSGTLTVIAGHGSSGAPTYGGPATSSALEGGGVASTPAGQVYVADTGNNTIDLLTPPAASPPTPPAAPTPVAPPPAPVAPVVVQTTASTAVKGQSATLGGVIAAHTTAVSYQFDYGSSATYGHVTVSTALAADAGAQAVTARIAHLIPGRVYHYRIQVTTASGTVSDGADMTLRTLKVAPTRVRDHIYHYWARTAPYHYRVKGSLNLVHGLTKQIACQSHGNATITATLDHKTIARHTVKVTRSCTYSSAFTFTTATLTGSGRMSFHMRFTGNHQLRVKQARTLNVLYGPAAKTR